MRALLFWTSLLLAIPASAQQPRDVRRPIPGGTARIVGTVRSADSEGRLLRRGRVMLNGDALPVGRTAIVDDSGAFAFEGLPPGRYALSAAKEGYVTVAYGARRPERPGRSIPLRNGETRTIALRLPRGAVITGTVLDPEGQPAPGVSVRALSWQYVTASGERRPLSAGAGETDDRGIYRIFGLSPGEYVVAGMPRVRVGDVQVLSDAEIKRALASVKENSAFRTRPGIPPSPPPPLPKPERRASVTLAPVYYPGTTVAARARTIQLAAAEERTAIDFQLDYVPTVTVSGMVSEPASITLMPPAATGLPMTTMRATTAGADGRFTFSGIAPGEYTILARVLAAGAIPRSPGGPPIVRAAQTDIFVTGDDVAGVSLALTPGLTVSGRLVFEGNTPAPPDLPGIRLPMPAYMPAGQTRLPFPPVQLNGEGRFTITGIVPGTYRLAGNAPAIRTSLAGWWLKSIVIDGHDVLDSSIELRADRDDAVVTFSDRASELTGRVTDTGGEPWVDGFVVVFSADPQMRFFNSRRVAGARPNSEGRYIIRNLPRGEYFAIAYDDILTNEWFDQTLLEQLAPNAMRLTIGEYEKKTQDMVVR